MSKTEIITFLYVFFIIKHFVFDYIVQIEYRQGWRRNLLHYLWPTTIHAGIHASVTLSLIMAINPSVWYLALVELLSHLIIDIVRINPNLLGRYKVLSQSDWLSATKEGARQGILYWWVLGLDQTLHYLTYVFIVSQMVP